MKIHSVRHGFATNSSSSHSLLIVAPGQGPTDYLVETGEFGWESFVAASDEAKRKYLAALLSANMDSGLYDHGNVDHVRAIVKQEIGIDFNPDWFVDHQSVYVLPRTWSGQCVDLAFFRELRDFFLRPDLVILGDNDNEPSSSAGFTLPVPQDCISQHWVARKDPSGYWVLFNRKDGTKVRFTFSDTQPAVERAAYPELVDVKITDLCPFGCAICYQGSTISGKHADYTALDRLVCGALVPRDSAPGVFEVAIGGGEPTLHPHFMTFARRLRNHGVVPNVTTRNVAWLGMPDLARDLADVMGGVAVSVDSRYEVERAADYVGRSGFPLGKLSVQYVVGAPRSGRLGDDHSLCDIMKTCASRGLPLTLLGFKATGRAKGMPGQQEAWLATWLGFREEHKDRAHVLRVGIDTVLAQQAVPALKEAGVPDWCYEVEEGRFSAYVDAVSERVGPSSYCEPSKMRAYGDDPRGALEEVLKGANHAANA